MMELLGVLDALDEYSGEIIADFRRFYGISAIDALGGDEMSLQEVIALVQNLPMEGAFARAQAGKMWGWGVDQTLLMAMTNEMKILNYHFLLANGQKPKKPKLLEAPTPEAEKPTEESLEIEARMLRKWQEEAQNDDAEE